MAGQIVKDDESLFIGPGYTCLEVANSLKRNKRISIVTNNISAAIELACIPEYRTIVVPGEFTKRNGTYYVTGSATQQYVNNIYVDKVFITADGVSLPRGFSVLDDVNASIIRTLREHSKEMIVCVESTRFGRNALEEIGPLSCADTIVTDRCPPSEYLDAAKTSGIRVIFPDDSID